MLYVLVTNGSLTVTEIKLRKIIQSIELHIYSIHNRFLLMFLVEDYEE